MTDFTRWLQLQMDSRRPPVTKAQVAAAIGTSDSGVGAWFKTTIPDPRQCAKVASYFHRDLDEVLRAAGHLPPLTEPAEPPAIPPDVALWLPALAELPLEDRDAVALIVRRLHATLDPRTPYDPQRQGPQG